ncbi:ISLre2 family transposase [Lactococcus garvieae]|uniref:ISLre2 family transposase n=1 Tax=Lactococcus garvieae TaxID=1363 RepID=UPI00254BC5F4|nr:ISLre2 family transposase [Lactococcus garvieae]
MDTILSQIFTIFTQESDILSKEAKLYGLMTRVFSEIMTEAFEMLDHAAVQAYLEKGYQIEKRSNRQVTFLFGTVSFKRYRLIHADQPAIYPLDHLLCLEKRQQFSKYMQNALAQASTCGVFRKVSEVINLVSNFSISHQSLHTLSQTVGQAINQAQSEDLEQEGTEDLNQKVKVLYLEGDAFCVKAQGGGLLYLHRVQVCEGRKMQGHRSRLIGYHDFIDLDRKKVFSQLLEYLNRTYDMRRVVLVSNSDNGSGYTSQSFKDLCLPGTAHEHFIDRYHVNKKIRERLRFVPEALKKGLQNSLYRYDEELLTVYYYTIESYCQTAEDEENLSLLKAYLSRNWRYLEPFEQRERLSGLEAVIGTCESNHRFYTYRMKKQGKYWSAQGALLMAKLLSAKRNNELAKYTILEPLPAVPDVILPQGFMRHLFKSHLPEYRDRYRGHIPSAQLNTRFNRAYGL